MSPRSMLGMLLIVLGIAAFAYEGIDARSRETVIDVGRVQVTAEKTRHIPLQPVAGAVAIGVGIILMAMDYKKLVPAGARS
ncbi:MAG TPA: DUF3185 domain-containing protein [Candidatus Polarisedimenticolia bacterium]|nr:DUF3185 domain-containing protein [Candidatus Polarisedimenticolia bacterium]